jgi:hypothetical protein
MRFAGLACNVRCAVMWDVCKSVFVGKRGSRIWYRAMRPCTGGMAPRACAKHVSCYARISSKYPIFSNFYNYRAPCSTKDVPAETFLRTKSCGADQLGPLHAPRGPCSWSNTCDARAEALSTSSPVRRGGGSSHLGRTPMPFGRLGETCMPSPLRTLFPPLRSCKIL